MDVRKCWILCAPLCLALLAVLATFGLALPGSAGPGGSPSAATHDPTGGGIALSGTVRTYCTAQVNSSACVPSIGAAGAPSASASSGFLIGAVRVVGNRPGMIIYSTNGAASTPMGIGFICVAPPVNRTEVRVSFGGGPCGGGINYDFNTWIASGADPALTVGQHVHAQWWMRDPPDPFGINLTDAIEFVVGP